MLLIRRLLALAAVLVALAMAAPLFAQTGGLTGRCVGDDGKPLAGYTIVFERQEIKQAYRTKTNKKGDYIYIGLPLGMYKITLKDTAGQDVFSIAHPVEYGDPTVVDINVAKERAQAQKEAMANPEYQKKMAEQVKETKQYTNLKEVFDQGQFLYTQAKYSEAAARFEQALTLAKDKNIPVVLSRLADAYTKAGSTATALDSRKADWAKAQEYFEKAMQADPGNAGLHNNLGSLYAQMGKITEAQQEFQKAADMNPAGAGTYYYNLGVILVNGGKMDDAAAALKKCTDLDPKNAAGFYWYGMALMGKANYNPDGTIVPVPGTIEAFETYLKLDPNGQWAKEAQASLQTLQSKVPTEFKKVKKKKG